MTYFRSIKRFILISLALLGLSVSSANASLKSGFDPIFRADSITIDSETGLEWLDLKHTNGMQYNYVSGQFDAGQEFAGWRYASASEVSVFWTNGGGTPSYTGAAGDWVADVLNYWGRTSGGVRAYFITADISVAGTHDMGKLTDLTTKDIGGPLNPYYAELHAGTYDDGLTLGPVGSALVRITAVPVPPAIWLFGTALIGLVGFGKRRRAA